MDFFFAIVSSLLSILACYTFLPDQNDQLNKTAAGPRL